jgi:hypothetical protein
VIQVGHIPYICAIDHQPENMDDSQIAGILGGKTNNNLQFHFHNIEQCWGGVVDHEF